MSWVNAATFFLSGLSIGANAVMMLFQRDAKASERAKEAARLRDERVSRDGAA